MSPINAIRELAESFVDQKKHLHMHITEIEEASIRVRNSSVSKGRAPFRKVAELFNKVFNGLVEKEEKIEQLESLVKNFTVISQKHDTGLKAFFRRLFHKLFGCESIDIKAKSFISNATRIITDLKLKEEASAHSKLEIDNSVKITKASESEEKDHDEKLAPVEHQVTVTSAEPLTNSSNTAPPNLVIVGSDEPPSSNVDTAPSSPLAETERKKNDEEFVSTEHQATTPSAAPLTPVITEDIDAAPSSPLAETERKKNDEELASAGHQVTLTSAEPLTNSTNAAPLTLVIVGSDEPSSSNVDTAPPSPLTEAERKKNNEELASPVAPLTLVITEADEIIDVKAALLSPFNRHTIKRKEEPSVYVSEKLPVVSTPTSDEVKANLVFLQDDFFVNKKHTIGSNKISIFNIAMQEDLKSLRYGCYIICPSSEEKDIFLIFERLPNTLKKDILRSKLRKSHYGNDFEAFFSRKNQFNKLKMINKETREYLGIRSMSLSAKEHYIDFHTKTGKIESIFANELLMVTLLSLAPVFRGDKAKGLTEEKKSAAPAKV